MVPGGIATAFGRSLRARLVLVLALAMMPLAIIGVGGAYSSYMDESEAARRSLVQTAKIVTDEHQTMIAGARQVLAALATQEAVQRATSPACQLALQRALYRLPEYLMLFVMDRDGTVRCSDQPIDTLQTPADQSWFQEALRGDEFVVSEILVDHNTKSRGLIAAVPLLQGGAVSGVIAMSVDLSNLIRLSQGQVLPDRAFVALADAKGELLPLVGSQIPAFPAAWWAEVMRTARSKSISAAETPDDHGTSYVLALAPLRPGSLYAVLGQPSSSLFAWLWIKLLTGLAVPLLLSGAALVAAWIAADRLVLRWVQRLRALAASFAEGGTGGPRLELDAAPEELRDLAASMTRMMRTIEKRNAELNQALANRDLLIREIHHRVKNNLQIISSLLNLQARNLPPGPAQQFAVDIRSRLAALALVHRNLYEINEVQQQIELRGFLDALCVQLEELVSAKSRNIVVLTEIGVASVSPDTAATLAMLVTEAVTNAFKHAFEPQRGGEIRVRFEAQPEGTAMLTIADDGIGTPMLEDGTSRIRGLGLNLMDSYVRQLGGQLSTSSNNGTTITVAFPKLP
jgi:two-component sensor histidine kinase